VLKQEILLVILTPVLRIIISAELSQAHLSNFQQGLCVGTLCWLRRDVAKTNFLFYAISFYFHFPLS